MSAFGTSTPLRAPWGLVIPSVGAAHPRSPRGAVAGDAPRLNPAPQPQSVGSPPTSKGQAATRCFASLDRFPAPSASDRFATPKEMERGQGDAVVHFTLDALESTQHSQPRGMWIGFATCPCGLTSEWGLGQSPRSSFWFWLGKLKIIPKKKRCSLCRILEC